MNKWFLTLTFGLLTQMSFALPYTALYQCSNGDEFYPPSPLWWNEESVLFTHGSGKRDTTKSGYVYIDAAKNRYILLSGSRVGVQSMTARISQNGEDLGSYSCRLQFQP